MAIDGLQDFWFVSESWSVSDANPLDPPPHNSLT